MKYTFFAIPFLFVSCAQVNQHKSAMHFPYAEELVEKVQKVATRAPSSEILLEEKSPRRTYFITLYHQYLTFSQYLGKESEINFCPQFHHDKIETEAVGLPKVSFYKEPRVSSQGKDYFPELAFGKKFSIQDYHQDLGTELLTLCEEGVSDNFYKFDNLVTHYAEKDSFHKNAKAMASVLKIPVFANYYLLKMMDTEKRSAFTHPEEKRLIEITRTHWLPEYVREAGKRRSSLLGNQLVTR